jgi:DNA (cytosine-5)-methyltransferase 1
MNELALFAGAGGGILAGHLLGWRTVVAVEWEPYPAAVLAARQNEGILPPFPVWDDVQTFDGGPWRGLVDVVSGGFPCQDISIAGKGAGIDGKRSGMWHHMGRIIGEVRPRYCFVENSPILTGRGLDRVLGDLAALGYDAEWGVFAASDVGAPHVRERIWILAHAAKDTGVLRAPERNVGRDLPAGIAGDGGDSRMACWAEGRQGSKVSSIVRGSWWRNAEPRVGKLVDGVADGVEQLGVLGNGQVPGVAWLAWHVLHARLEGREFNPQAEQV